MKKASLSIMFIALLFFGCKPSSSLDNTDIPTVVDMLDVSLLTINFTSEKDASLIVVKTNTDWTATKTADWLSLSATSGNKNTGFLIGAPKNNGSQRNATVTIKSGDKTKEIKVTQAGVP